MQSCSETLVHLWRSKEKRLLSGCYFAGAIEVIQNKSKGCIVVASADLLEKQIILVEAALPPNAPPPTYLHPKSTAEIPPCVGGFPFGLIPGVVFAKSLFLMGYLRFKLNVFDRLHSVGSAFSHSCKPNALRLTRDDGLSLVITSSPIPVGEEVTVSYVNKAAMPHIPRFARRLILLYKFGFWCECPRCTDGGNGQSEQLRKYWLSARWDEESIERMGPDICREYAGIDRYPCVSNAAHSFFMHRYTMFSWALFGFKLVVLLAVLPAQWRVDIWNLVAPFTLRGVLWNLGGSFAIVWVYGLCLMLLEGFDIFMLNVYYSQA